jgi:hypothetical protein
MKNKLLLLLTCLVCLSLSAQQAKHSSTSPVYTRIADAPGTTLPQSPSSSSIDITFLDTLYSNDFSDSTLFSQNDASGASSQWVFGTNTTISNGFFAAPFASTTAGNGYAMFNYFGFNADPLFANSSITLGPINLSNATAPLTVNFEQYYAKFRDSAQVWYSLDSINFTLLGDNTNFPLYGVNAQGQTIGAISENGELKSIFASQLAGQTNVWLRFRYASDDGGYSWLVDDLTITNVSIPSFDLSAVSAVNCDINTQYSYAQTPLTQVQPVGFTILLENNGGADQIYTVDYEILLEATVVDSGSVSVNDTIFSFTSDTLAFVTSYTPTAVGDYTINLTIDTDSLDTNLTDNTTSTTFSITDFLMSPIDNTLSSTATPGITYSGAGPAPNYLPNKIGQSFFINADQPMGAVEIGVFKPSTFTGEQSFVIEIYEIDTATGRPKTSFLSISDYLMTTSHSNTEWKRILLDSPLLLEAGKTYVASVGYESNDLRFFISATNEDLDFGSWIYGPYGASSAVNWFVGLDASPAIRLNFDPTVGIKDVANSTSNIIVYPNPADNVVRVAMTLFSPEAYTVRMLDINGRVVFSKSQSKSSTVSETISLDQIAGGVYTIQVSTATGVSISKVVVSH